MRMFILAGLAACTMAASAGAMIATFDADTLLQLDHYSSNLLTARVMGQEPGLGGGVVFDIRFPGPGPLDTQLFYTAVQNVDLSVFDTFALTFSVVSLDGIDPMADIGLYASPFIRDAAGIPHFWELTYLDLTGGPAVITQDIPVSALAVGQTLPGDLIQEIGFDVRVESDLFSPDGFTLGLLVTPTQGAVVIPEPATLALLAAGVLYVRRRQQRRI